MNFAFHPVAESEFNAAIDWYEERLPGLGQAFALEVRHAVHRALANRYPYGVLYAVEPDRIYVAAVMHLRQRPGYWRGRLLD
jgi:hypothetical protein